MTYYLLGTGVRVDNTLCVSHTWEQVRFPRSKKRRIRKKWKNNQANWGRVPHYKVYRVGNMLLVHSVMLQRIIRRLNRANAISITTVTPDTGIITHGTYS